MAPPDFTLMAVSIRPGDSSLEVSTPTRLFQLRRGFGDSPGRNYNVAADGRFLVNVTATDAPITVILNWAAGLKK